MINRIYTALAAAGIILLALFGIHRSGKSKGRERERQERNEEILKRHIEVQKEVNNAASITSDDVNDRLRNGEF